MTIEYIEPIARAWQRMLGILFRPFKLEKWLVIGFAAWLAGLAGGNSGGFGWNIGDDWDWGDDDSSWRIEETLDPGQAVPAAYQRVEAESFTDHLDWLPFAVGCLAIVIPLLILLVVLLLWLSSRGQFIFLDNVVLDRAEIVRPWKAWARQGNSLVLWRLSFVVVLLVAFAACAGAIFLIVKRDLGWPLIVAVVCVVVLLAFAAALVDVFLRHFVVPLMYKHQLTANDGWRRFLPLLRGYPLQFFGYAVLLLLLWILAGLAIAVAGFLTCCIGFILLAIPYVGTVLLLPLLVFFRLFALEFLRQFGPEGDLLAPLPAPPPAPAA